jgi:hypothetical protein
LSFKNPDDNNLVRSYSAPARQNRRLEGSSLPFRMFMTAALTLIGICFYALQTKQTAGDLCRNTGSELVVMAHYVDGPEELVSAGSQLIAKSGHSLKDSCSRY